MKPSDFTMNSDYLSIAQTGSNTYTVNVAGGTLSPGGNTEQNFDFTTTAQNGSVDRIMISKDAGDYIIGSYMRLIPTWEADFSNNVVGFIRIHRTSSTNIRAQVVLENYAMGASSTYSAMTFSIKVASFKPPNVF